MALLIDDFVNYATKDEELRKEIVCIHDNLLMAYKIWESVKEAAKLQENPSEKVLLATFQELQKTKN